MPYVSGAKAVTYTIEFSGDEAVPLWLSWRTNFGFCGGITLDDRALQAVAVSPCCEARLLQKTTPPTCLMCETVWAAPVQLDPEWREFFLQSRIGKTQLGLLDEDFHRWLFTACESLTGPLAAMLLQQALLQKFSAVRAAMDDSVVSQAALNLKQTGGGDGVASARRRQLYWAENFTAAQAIFDGQSGSLLSTAGAQQAHSSV